MRIVIDFQGAQSSSRFRGIGRYALSIVKAIVRNRGTHEIFIMLNELFPESIQSIIASFDGLLPKRNIRVWCSPAPVSMRDEANHWRRQAAEITREAYLASLKPDVILVTSLFEGLGDNVVTSVGVLHRIPTAVILYDLIPLIYRELYLENVVDEQWYETKLGFLRRADLLLAISASARDEAIHYLNFPEEQVINVGTAADLQFKQMDIPRLTAVAIRARLKLTKPFVMSAGGNEPRKNIKGLFAAFALLPEALQKSHQLVIVCKVDEESKDDLLKQARSYNLPSEAVILTGYIPEDELIVLYHQCAVFIFPSWHEGFGLPALEAMACGAPVIASNSSSLPEVVGWDEALFDPFNSSDIASKLTRALTDEEFRKQLIKNGLKQAKCFSWDDSSRRVINALEVLHSKNIKLASIASQEILRPKLAYVSQQSTLNDYDTALLPQLSRFYDIEIITDQNERNNAQTQSIFQLRTCEWFRKNAHCYDRVLYHFGNGHTYSDMFEMQGIVPGIVVLHQFNLSPFTRSLDTIGKVSDSGTRALYYSHGYPALVQTDHQEYPCNREILDDALGVIVHSDTARRLATQWYGADAAKDWTLIPLLKSTINKAEPSDIRKNLKIPEDAFVVCNFGFPNDSKLSHHLLAAWHASSLAKDARCYLIFVGDNNDASLVTKSNDRILFTGYVDTTIYKQYLTAADLAVQLCAFSNNDEILSVVLACMNYGVATIINAEGSLIDLTENAVWVLQDKWSNAELVNALETLWRDDKHRLKISDEALKIIRTRHAPLKCGEQYHQAIESAYAQAQMSHFGAMKKIATLKNPPNNDANLKVLAMCMAQNQTQKAPRQLLVDISELVQKDAKTGVQRVVRSILQELLSNPPAGYRVEPIYCSDGGDYCYARQFTLGFLTCPSSILLDDIIEFHYGDHFIGLDLQHHVVLKQRGFYQQLRNHGVRVQFVVYDLLPILHPETFNAHIEGLHKAWLSVVAESDGAICISKTVANELTQWLSVQHPSSLRKFNIGWFHLGADISNSTPSKGMPENAQAVLAQLAENPSFLMIGTIEPRKKQDQAIEAFELLWEQGINVNLVIVGKQGWMVDALIKKLKKHSLLNKRLFWLNGISDEYLEKIYASSSCLIAASLAEGFGLPLIEAAQHELPIIARDIPIFREVAGDHAFYFSGLEPKELALAVQDWLKQYVQGKTPISTAMPFLTWHESAQQLMSVMLTNSNNKH